MPTATPRPADSAFEASTIERRLAREPSPRWIAWRQRLSVAAALLGCVGLLLLARALAAAPTVQADWVAGDDGRWQLHDSALPALQSLRGLRLQALEPADPDAPAAPALADIDLPALQPSARWIAGDMPRARQQAAQRELAALLAQGALRLRFTDGSTALVPTAPRGLAGLGLAFWALAVLALGLVLLAVAAAAARPQARNTLFLAMALAQALQLLFVAADSLPGLGGGLGAAWAPLRDDLPWRMACDALMAAAVLHALALHPQRLPHALAIAAGAWGAAALALGLALRAPPPGLWWWWQAGCALVSALALVRLRRAWQREHNPFLAVFMRLALATLAVVVGATALGALAAAQGAPRAALAAAVAWSLVMAAILGFAPFIARTAQLLRELVMLIGFSAAAAALDLLLVAGLTLEPLAALAVSVGVALAAYAAARPWLLDRYAGRGVISTDRAFEQLFQAARQVQARPAHYADAVAQLMRGLFDPLELLRVEGRGRVATLVGGGAALVVTLRPSPDMPADGAPAAALVLRFADRGQRLFTQDDARLAQRMIEQLQRAVAYDQAVERGRTEERLRIAQDLHDDIGARLLTLMYQAHTPEMEEYIRHTLQDLKTLTRGLATRDHRLSHAAAEWKADLTHRLTAAHVHLAWSCEFDRDMTLSMVQWSALTRVLRELVSNALHHAQATRVEVVLRLEGRRLALTVADDGHGRAPETWAHGLGLGGVRKRVKLLGGEVRWRENAPGGIVCEVRVPEFGEPR